MELYLVEVLFCLAVFACIRLCFVTDISPKNSKGSYNQDESEQWIVFWDEEGNKHKVRNFDPFEGDDFEGEGPNGW